MNNKTDKIFEYIDNMLQELSLVNSSSEKKKILELYYKLNPECFNKLIVYTYSHEKQYHITSKIIKENLHLISNNHQTGNIFDLLDILNAKTRTGSEAIEWVNNYIRDNGYCEIVYKMIDRDLKAGISKSLIKETIKKYNLKG